MSELIKTYTMDAGGTPLIETNIHGLLDALEQELEYQEPDGEGKENEIEIVIKISRSMTQEQVDNLPEWDG